VTRTRASPLRPAPDPAAVEAHRRHQSGEAPGDHRRPRRHRFRCGGALAQSPSASSRRSSSRSIAKHAMLEDHSCSAARWTVRTQLREHVVAEADLVIYAGSNTSDHTTATGQCPNKAPRSSRSTSIHSKSAANYPVRDRTTVRRACRPRSAGDGRRRVEARRLARAYAEIRRRVRVEAEKRARPSSCRCARAPRQELNEVLPKDAIVIADTGICGAVDRDTSVFCAIRPNNISARRLARWSFPASLGANAQHPTSR